MDQRIEFAMKSLYTDNFRALCAEYGISTKTGYKWQGRFMRLGVEGMQEESRRPKGHPDQLSEGEVCEMVRLKLAHRNWGPRKIQKLYERLHGRAASESSFKRVLEHAGLTRPRRHRQPAGQAGRLWSGRVAQAPNEVWTVDFKGWWYDQQRVRCEPLTVRDEYSRYVLEVRRMADARGSTVRACFERLFERHGLPAAIRSDNGTPFAHPRALFGLSRLSVWWVALGIDLERGRPGCPQDNGGHERLHRDMSAELQPGTSEQAALELWREEFNRERPHEALGMKCPAEVYQNSSRAYEGTPEDLEYPGLNRRLVTRLGTIVWHQLSFFLSASLTGWSVGLKPVEQGRYEIWFGRLLLGWMDPATHSFLRAEDRPQEAVQP